MPLTSYSTVGIVLCQHSFHYEHPIRKDKPLQYPYIDWDTTAMFEITFRNLAETLRKNAGCATEMDYIE